jgi:hypothetical protein
MWKLKKKKKHYLVQYQLEKKNSLQWIYCSLIQITIFSSPAQVSFFSKNSKLHVEITQLNHENKTK